MTIRSDSHTDIGNAELFIDHHGELVRYCASEKKWLVWSGGSWEWDNTEISVYFAQNTVKEMLAQAFKVEDEDKRKASILHAIRSSSMTKIEAMLHLARACPEIAVRTDELDGNPLLFNCDNGTFDLGTMKLKAPDPSDLITRRSLVRYDPAAQCPNWKKFLREITANCQPVIDYLQRAAGYSLCGEVTEHVLFLVWGSGQNGKSTFIEALRNVFGPYASAADFSTFASGRSMGGARNDIARLARSRLVTASESEKGCALAESLIKQLTGGDTVAARFLYLEAFEFKPMFKLWMFTNYLPKNSGGDGIWRRVKLIPFSVRIPDDQIDGNLPVKLQAEASGILNWVIEGYAQFRVQGLNTPDEIKSATSGYRMQEDVLGRFIAACCSIGPAFNVKARTLYEAFQAWTSSFGEPGLDERKFAQVITASGITGKRTAEGRMWQGITLAVPGTQQPHVA
jgi:putative DNA primase/helicase